MLAGCAGEYAAYLADQPATHPQTSGLIEEVAHLSAHVAKARWRAEDDGVVLWQLIDRGNRRCLIDLEMRFACHLFGHEFRHTLDSNLSVRDFACALCNGAGHGFDMAVGTVVEDKKLRHDCSPMLRCPAGHRRSSPCLTLAPWCLAAA